MRASECVLEWYWGREGWGDLDFNFRDLATLFCGRSTTLQVWRNGVKHRCRSARNFKGVNTFSKAVAAPTPESPWSNILVVEFINKWRCTLGVGVQLSAERMQPKIIPWTVSSYSGSVRFQQQEIRQKNGRLKQGSDPGVVKQQNLEEHFHMRTKLHGN